MEVYKFGGGVLDNATAIKNLVKIVSNRQPSVVVISAMGKTTNELEKIYAQVLRGRACNGLENSLFSYYKSIAFDLFGKASEADLLIEEYRKSLISILSRFSSFSNEESFYSSIVSLGELMTSQLVSISLNKESENYTWIDARTCIKTCNGYTNGEIDWSATQQMVKEKVFPLINSGNNIVTQGFIGSNQSGETTTLGREGSDYTAAIVASCISATSVFLYKNVPGVMTANIKLFNNSKKLNSISYNSLRLITNYGSQLVHKKTIAPLQENDIVLYIKNFYNDEDKGTLVNNLNQEYKNTTILVDHKCLFVSINNSTDKKKKGFADILNLVNHHKAKILIINHGSLTLKLCITTPYQHKYEELIKDLDTAFDVKEIEYAYIVSILYAQNYENFFTKRPKPLMWNYDRIACQVVIRDRDIVEYGKQVSEKLN